MVIQRINQFSDIDLLSRNALGRAFHRKVAGIRGHIVTVNVFKMKLCLDGQLIVARVAVLLTE